MALRFLLDHLQDLTDAPGAALALIEAGLRRRLACPAPATLDCRIASWRAFHRMQNLPSPFAAPLVSQGLAEARRAGVRPRARSSENIICPVLEAMLATCDHSHRGLRDKALLMLGWASGGRRRPANAALSVDDVNMRNFDSGDLLRIRLLATKTSGPELAFRLPLKGRPAWAVMAWITVAPARTGRGSASSARPTAC